MAIMSLSIDGFLSQQPVLIILVLHGTSSSSQQLSEQSGLSALAVAGPLSQQPLEQFGSGTLEVAELSSQQRSKQPSLSTWALAGVSSQQPSEQPALGASALAGVSSQQASEQLASGFVPLGEVLPLPQQASTQLKLISRVSGSGVMS